MHKNYQIKLSFALHLHPLIAFLELLEEEDRVKDLDGFY